MYDAAANAANIDAASAPLVAGYILSEQLYHILAALKRIEEILRAQATPKPKSRSKR